jgi:hypothetical protein
VPPKAIGPTPVSAACAAFGGDGGLIGEYGAACLGHAATFGSCATFEPPDAAGAEACYRCLVTPEDLDAASWGAVIGITVPTVNYVGCIEALDPSDAGTSCAEAVAAAEGCAAYACACPVTDDPSHSAYLACLDDALAGGCAGYSALVYSCLAAEEGDGGSPVATVCLAGSTAEDHYLALARHFCGGM